MRLQWSRRNEAHPIGAPIVHRIYQPHMRKLVSITPVPPPPSPTQEEQEETDVSDAQLLEVARAWDEKVSASTTPDAYTVSKSEESSA